MAQNIMIRSVEVGGDLLMYAKPSVLTENKGETFHIHNKVDSEEVINVKFYKLHEKGVVGAEIPGFCTEMGSDTVLIIEENKMKKCTTPSSVSHMNFAYTVENADAETLDPVIIIDDAIGGEGFSLLFMLLAGGGGVVVGALGGRYFKSKRNAAS